MSTEKRTIDIALIRKQFTDGATVKMVLENLNQGLSKEDEGRVSENTLKKACKAFNINLRTKPLPSKVVFVDSSATKAEAVEA